ncbi:MAG: hypothetical protein II544_02475, partial [Spirochaetales bacterium]|nr:hypothetical protein [Spirochaetales bacterium]
ILHYGEWLSGLIIIEDLSHGIVVTHQIVLLIPVPDPIIEKQKKLFVYDPAKFHDYSVEKPSMVDLGNGHFIYGNAPEIENYKKIRFGS